MCCDHFACVLLPRADFASTGAVSTCCLFFLMKYNCSCAVFPVPLFGTRRVHTGQHLLKVTPSPSATRLLQRREDITDAKIPCHYFELS